MEYVEFHKGGLCIHRFQLCQEGFCSECIIHHDILRARNEPVRPPVVQFQLLKKELVLAR